MYVCLYGNLIPARLPPYRSPKQVQTKNHLEAVGSFQANPKEPSKKRANPGINKLFDAIFFYLVLGLYLQHLESKTHIYIYKYTPCKIFIITYNINN